MPEDALARARIAARLDYPDWEALRADLDGHRTHVAEAFAEILLPRGNAPSLPEPAAGAELWRAARAQTLDAEAMRRAGFRADAGAISALAGVAAVRGMSARATRASGSSDAAADRCGAGHPCA